MILGRGRSTVADEAALLTLELPPRRQAATAARRALTSLNGAMRLVSEARLRDAQLMVSEVVANAVRHGGDGQQPVRLEVRATDEALHVAVIDVGLGFAPDRLASPSLDRAGGWGLALVAALARGVEAGVLTSVWFEIDRPQRESPVLVRDTIVMRSPGPEG
jgi:anti-sigma regulatory factor (Ser/Thr protein kinase)